MDISEKKEETIISKDELRRDIAIARTERYYRTARFIQSKWFMIGGGLAIAIFLLLIFLIG